MEEETWFEEENNEDCSDVDSENGSETHDAQSETSEYESEIDLLEFDRLQIDAIKDFIKGNFLWFQIRDDLVLNSFTCKQNKIF
jgi:hypothetical protein